MDFENVLKAAIQDGIRDGVKAKLSSSYGDNPMSKLITEVLNKHDSEFRAMLVEALGSAIGDKEFREQIKVAVRHALAKTLISRSLEE